MTGPRALGVALLLTLVAALENTVAPWAPWGWLYEKSGSLWPSVLSHYLFNVLG